MRSELKKEDKKNEHELELLKENLLKLQNSDNSDENDKEMYEFILNNYKAKISELEKTIAKNKSDKNREKEWLKNYQELQDQEWLKRKARYELKLKEQQNNTQNQ